MSGTHESLVPPTTFDRAQELQKARGRNSGERSFRAGSGLRSPFLLSGLIRCARCGHAYQGRTINSTKHRKDGTKIQVLFLRRDGQYFVDGICSDLSFFGQRSRDRGCDGVHAGRVRTLKLIQIPFSHSCIKVRRALELKGLAYETQDINPVDRKAVIATSGQGLVPVLVDGGRAIADSTAILLYLEETYPRPPLLPADPALRAECLLLEDWSDAVLLPLTRRLAYWHTLSVPGTIERLFFPGSRGLRRWIEGRLGRRAVRRRFGLSADRNRRDEAEVRRAAQLALDRLGGRSYLVGDTLTLADVALAALSAPLWAAASHVRDDQSVLALLDWSRAIVGEEIVSLYRN